MFQQNMKILNLFLLEIKKNQISSSQSVAEDYKMLNKNIEILLFEASFYVYIKLICSRMTLSLDA